MDDQFFAKLREIQKKERANSSLARVGSDFYKKTHGYLDSIRDVARNDPFSEESDLLKNVQRIATEICEIREHKIADAAVINIHRSYHLFQGKPQFDLVDTTPLNITEEEETLYFSFIDVLKNHRRVISLDQLTTTDNEVIHNKEIINNEAIDDNGSADNSSDDELNNSSAPKSSSNDSNISTNSNSSNNGSNSNNNINEPDKTDIGNDKVLNRLNKIKSSKVIEDESYESIEKQVIKSKYSESNVSTTNLDKDESIQEKPKAKSQIKTQSKSQVKVESKVQSETERSSDLKDKKNTSVDNNIETNNKAKITNDESTKFNSNDKGIVKPKSGFSNVIGNEDEQFVDLDLLNQDIDHNFDDNSYSRTNSKSTVDRISNVMVLIFSEINSIIGVDNKVYGPFQPQDVVIMPDINAEILVKNKKGRLVKV